MDGGAWWRLAALAIGAGLAFALTRTYLFDFAAPALALSLALGMLGLASPAHYGGVLATGGTDPSRRCGAADRDVDTARVDR